MAKKKKKKDKLYGFLDFGLQMMRSGELKVKKGCVISMNEISKPSIDNTKGARVDLVEDLSEVKIDAQKILSINGHCGDMVRAYKFISSIGTDEIPTVVMPLSRKQATKEFLYQGGMIGYLAKVSNLATIFNAVKENWQTLLDNSEGMDCILYIPEITILASDSLGKLLENRKKINLLVYVTKKKPHIYTNEDVYDRDDEDNDHTAREKLIGSMLECAVRLNCKHLIIDPFSHPLFLKDVDDSTDIWVEQTSTDRVTENIKVIDFTVDDDDLYIIFWRARRPTGA